MPSALADTNLPCPLSQWILFLRNRNSMPLVILFTIPSLRAIMRVTSIAALWMECSRHSGTSRQSELTARVLPLFDTRNRISQLRGADRGDIAAWTRANHNDVE